MKSYTTVIDLTSSGRKEKQPQDAFLKEPDPPLPPVTLDGLPPTMQQAVSAAGWSSLMPVQAHALPYILDRRDLIVQSRTGSGKTGAFLLPLFEVLDPNEKGTQVLVLVPTRELARQVQEEFEILRRGDERTKQLRSVAVYGGVSYKPQIDAFNSGAQVVIGTPGRVLDHLERGTLSLKTLRILVLDEADEMLSMGFFPDMLQLRRYLPRERQSYMFSATIPFKVRQLGREFLTEPGFLSLSEGKVHVDTMVHRYYIVGPMDKDTMLRRLIELQNPDSAIIFANTKKAVEYLSQMLQNYGYDAEPISGDLNQQARERVMKRIRDGKLRLLVATDVAARGIDISDLSHVFMYDVPQDTEYYIHRAGRTARAGNTGMAITLATVADRYAIEAIGRKYQIELEKLVPPTAEDVEERVAERATLLLEDAYRTRDQAGRDRIAQFLPVVRHLVETDQAESLALLIDLFYHIRLHEQNPDEPKDAEPHEPSETPESIDAEALAARLHEGLDAQLNLRRARLQRFLPLVTQFIEEGEPELLALLLDDFQAGRLAVTAGEPAKPPEKAVQHRSRRSRSGTGRQSSGRRRPRSS